MSKITYFKKLHFQNRKLSVIHIFKITFQMPISSKIAFSKSHFSHKSQFRSRFFTKIAFPKFDFSQKSHYFKCLIYVNLWIKSVILPQCVFYFCMYPKVDHRQAQGYVHKIFKGIPTAPQRKFVHQSLVHQEVYQVHHHLHLLPNFIQTKTDLKARAYARGGGMVPIFLQCQITQNTVFEKVSFHIVSEASYILVIFKILI